MNTDPSLPASVDHPELWLLLASLADKSHTLSRHVY